MPRATWAKDEVYAAAEQFVDQCLRQDGSLFSPGRPIWAPASIEDFYTRFVIRADEGTGSFMQKLAQQLAGASDPIIQLAAEMIFFNYLCEDDTGAAHKRATVANVLSLMATPVSVPRELDAAYPRGLARIGLAKTQKWQQLAFLLEFMRAWKSLEPQARSEMLADAGAFREFTHSVPKHSASVQVEGLLHLVFPDEFESVVSPSVKRAIVKALGEYLDGTETDVDAELASIRKELEAEHGPDFSFYDAEVAPRWQETKGGSEAFRAWLVRGANNRALGEDGVNMLPQWFREGFVSIGWPNAEPFSMDADTDDIREALEKANPALKPGEIIRGSGIVQRFFSIRDGDLIVTPDGDKLYVARASGDPYWSDEDDLSALRCNVEWLNAEDPASRAEVRSQAPGLWASLRTLLTVSNLEQHAQAVAALVSIETPGPEPEPGSASVAALAAELTIDESEIKRILALIEHKRQAIFYGPPGTGKTFVALRLARHLAGDDSRVRLVQFHASYAYEDFVEGYRPTVEGGQPGFRISRGPLRELAAMAELKPDETFVLVIDEVNRGNVAKVFGELYFLLEYRNERVVLQYSDDNFRLPPNLLVIGTMNTADRTIAILDAALRRRFYFVPFFPGKPPVNDLLRRWLDKNKPALGWVADAVDRANKQLSDAHLAIGHSFFIDGDLDEERVREVWDHAILPTIEEHYFGQPERVRGFELDRLRRGVDGAEGDADGEDDGGGDAEPT